MPKKDCLYRTFILWTLSVKSKSQYSSSSAKLGKKRRMDGDGGSITRNCELPRLPMCCSRTFERINFSAASQCREKVVKTGIKRGAVQPWCHEFGITQALKDVAGVN